MNEYVGQAIHMRLWRQGIPQRELAEVLGIGQSTMSKKLRGSVSWTVQELVSSAVFLDVPPVDLLPRVDSNHQPADIRRARLALVG